MNIYVSAYPFGKSGKKSRELLDNTNWKIIYNPMGRRLKLGEIEEICPDIDAIIAGTEPYTKEVIDKLPNLKVISRVGIGLDSVDLAYCREKGVKVTYTPDAPSQGVAELTVANILNLARYTFISDRSVRELSWNRYVGFLLEEMKIGIIGVGRIGKRVIKLLKPFNTEIIACDLAPDLNFSKEYNFNWVEKEKLFQSSDIVSLHIPMNKKNADYLNRETLALMKANSFLVNTARGGIIDEDALYDALVKKHLTAAALDVFKHEPYEGKLTSLSNVFFTAHMGASANKSRFLMETGAAEDCIRVLYGEEAIHNAITDSEKLGDI